MLWYFGTSNISVRKYIDMKKKIPVSVISDSSLQNVISSNFPLEEHWQ